MVELTAENIPAYLRQRGWLADALVTVEPLGWGVSNAVYRVTTPSRRFVIKQARPQLRTRDPWFSDLDRVLREQQVMQALHPLLPAPTVPEILFTDADNFVFAMSHAPDGAQVWKQSLLAGSIDLAVGERAGLILGRMHEATARNRCLVEPFADRRIFVQLRVDPFYYRIQQRLPDVAAAIEPLMERLLVVRDGLCHGDYSPKNILTHAQGFTLVDYETAHWGDPTMDLGFFLSHLLLKTVRNHHQCSTAFFELTRRFWRGYKCEVSFRPLNELIAWGIRHCGACLLARIDGTSPIEYLPEEPRREAVRWLGRRLLFDRPETWEVVLQLAEEACRSLSERE